MSKINLRTLAANAARAKLRLTKQETKLSNLNKQLIERVGTGGQTIQTTLGQVMVTAETVDREDRGFLILFNEAKFHELDPTLQAVLRQHEVVSVQKKIIRGQAPRVMYRLTEKV